MVDEQNDRLELFHDGDPASWGWRLVVNDRVLATSPEPGYDDLADAQHVAGILLSGDYSDLPVERVPAG